MSYKLQLLGSSTEWRANWHFAKDCKRDRRCTSSIST